MTAPDRSFILATNRGLEDLRLFHSKYVRKLATKPWSEVPACCTKWTELTDTLLGFNDSKESVELVLGNRNCVNQRIKGKEKEPSLN